MYMYIYVYIYTYIYIYTQIYIYIYIYRYIYIYNIYMYIYIHNTHIYICVRVYVGMCNNEIQHISELQENFQIHISKVKIYNQQELKTETKYYYNKILKLAKKKKEKKCKF